MNKLLYLLLATITFSCHSTKDLPHVIKVAATPVPQAEMLAFIKPDLKEQGYDLEIVVMDDYNLPNRALADKEVDANFFQHIPFLEQQMAQFHYPLCILAKIHIEPMGLYSKKITSLAALPDKAVVAIPSDPSNESRALLLLQKQGLITVQSGKSILTTRDILTNPKNLKFQEIDAAMLSRTFPDVTLAVIPTNFALQASLSPEKDALALEDKSSPYVNVIAVRCDDMNEPKLLALKSAMTSKKMNDFILSKYRGAVVPAFSSNP